MCVSDHLKSFERKRFKQLEENEDTLAQEIKHDVIVNHLLSNDLLTAPQYQRIIRYDYQYDANKYIIKLIYSQPPEYLTGFKEALVKAKQGELIDKLP